jgi:hypothetical protein
LLAVCGRGKDAPVYVAVHDDISLLSSSECLTTRARILSSRVVPITLIKLVLVLHRAVEILTILFMGVAKDAYKQA